jgi:hypothetical protein
MSYTLHQLLTDNLQDAALSAATIERLKRTLPAAVVLRMRRLHARSQSLLRITSKLVMSYPRFGESFALDPYCLQAEKLTVSGCILHAVDGQLTLAVTAPRPEHLLGVERVLKVTYTGGETNATLVLDSATQQVAASLTPTGILTLDRAVGLNLRMGLEPVPADLWARGLAHTVEISLPPPTSDVEQLVNLQEKDPDFFTMLGRFPGFPEAYAGADSEERWVIGAAATALSHPVLA